MKIECQKDDLQKAVSLVSRLVSPRTTLPILQNILFVANKDGLELRVTDLDQTIQCQVEARVEEAGSITVPARLLTEYIQNITDRNLQIDTDDTTLLLKSPNHNSKIKGLAAEEYPSKPDFKVAETISIEAARLVSAINATQFAISKDDARPVLTTLLFRIEKKKLTVVATDGYRLAKQEIIIDSNFEGDLLLPRRAVAEISRLTYLNQVSILIASNQVIFETGSIKITTRLLEGSFPSYEAIIPKKLEGTIKLSSQALLKSLRLASLFARDNAFSVRLTLSNNKLIISSLSAQIGESVNEIEVEQKSDLNFSISCNATYLIDVLTVLEGDVEIGFSGSKNPITVTKPDMADYLYLVMPLRQD